MNTTIAFSFKVRIHLFNGYATEAEGFGVVQVKDNKVLPEETIVALLHLAQVLRPIYLRLIANGYSMVDGKLTKPTEKV